MRLLLSCLVRSSLCLCRCLSPPFLGLISGTSALDAAREREREADAAAAERERKKQKLRSLSLSMIEKSGEKSGKKRERASFS
jgi:hypothetical protein